MLTNFHRTLAWIARQEADVQSLWRYGKDMHARSTTAQRELAQRNEELSVARSTIELLRSDCAIYSDGADALTETMNDRVDEIQQLTRQAEGLETKLAQVEEQNQALRDDLSEAQNRLQAALETPVEPSGRAARKKRKL